MTQRAFHQTEYPYFVTSNLHNRIHLFLNHDLVNILSNNIFYYQKRLDFILYSYCIMPDHIHMLLKSNSQYNLSKIMQLIKYHSAKDIHEDQKTTGSFWQSRFNYRIIDNERRLINTLNYIQNNPIKIHLSFRFTNAPYMYFNWEKINKLF